jgi:AraC-like DNA-binding protein
LSQTALKRFEKQRSLALLEFRVPGWPLAHSHDYYEIMYVAEGSGKHVIDRQIYEIVSGTLFFIPPLVSHKLIMRPNTANHFYNIELLPSLLKPQPLSGSDHGFTWDEIRLPSEEPDRRPAVYGMRCDEAAHLEILGAMGPLFAEDRYHRAHWVRLIPAHLQIVLGTLVRARLESRLHSLTPLRLPEEIWRALLYLDSNFTDALSIDDICRHSGLSRSNLSRQFRTLLDQTPIEYVADLRITKAITFLWTGRSVSETAYECGFKEPTYFGKVFRRRMGLTPAAFQRTRPGYTALYRL